MIPKELFASYVKDALRDLYSPGQLQIHPLVELLVAQNVAQETRGQYLRQVILEAIESLRPAEKVAFSRPEWLGYRVMWLRYVEALEPLEICRQLGLGRTSFYAYHRQALEAVISLLWERYQRQQTLLKGQSVTEAQLAPTELAREEAIRAAHSSERQSVSLSAMLESVKETILPLARNYGLELRVHTPTTLPNTFADPAILRQIFLSVLTEAIGLAAGNTLELSVTLSDTHTLWKLCGLAASKVAKRDLEHSTGFVVSRELLQVYQGRLWLERDEHGAPTLLLKVPIARPKTILIIDDNADTLELYRRYLLPRGFTLRVARNSDEVRASLKDALPDLILLDVLMPQQDGWDILQRLKTTPETAKVPVIICSVLSQPHLALALGAAKVLQKPIDQGTLVQAVQALLAQEDRKD